MSKSPKRRKRTPKGTNSERSRKDSTLPGERSRPSASNRVGSLAKIVSGGKSDAVIFWSIVLVLVVSRFAAFPASIWDTDEANFALGVIHFDPVHNQPHAPFFPLFVGLGKLANWIIPGGGPEGALRLVSAFFSVAILWPLWELWSMVMSRAQALAAAVLYLALPGPWLLSGRAYTEPTATALMVAGFALWLKPGVSRSRLAWGGVGVAAALLIRPQWLVVVAPLVIWRIIRGRGTFERAIVVGVPALIGAATVAVVTVTAGDFGPLWAAIQQHRKYIAGASQGFEWGYSDLSVHAAVGGIVGGTLWISIGLLGCFALLRDQTTGKHAHVILGLGAAPFVLMSLTMQNPTLPRYALPILALTSGAVVAGISMLVGRPRWAVAAIGVWVSVSAAVVLPVLTQYRQEASPVVSAFNRIESSPSSRVIAVDRRLVAFVALERAKGRLHQQVVWDYQVELGMVESSYRPDLAAIATEPEPGWIAEPDRVTGFKCRDQLLRRVASPRFLEMTVVEGCALVRPENPSVRPEDLRPGVVITAK